MGDMTRNIDEGNAELSRLLANLTAEDVDPVGELGEDAVEKVDSGHDSVGVFYRLDDLAADPAVPFDADTDPDTVGEVLARHLPMRAAEYGPSAMFAIYPLVDKTTPSMEISGIVGDTKHGSGYHRSRNGLKAAGKSGDYSIQLPADRRGDGNACTAIDLKFSYRDMKLVTARLMTAFKPNSKGEYDPRIECCREFFGTLNGTSVTGWNRAVTGRPVGYVTSDASHLWHVHVSVFRDYATDRNRMYGLAEVLAGVPAGTYGWKNPDAKPAVVTPVVPVDPPVEPVYTQIVELDAPGAGNWQCAVQNVVSGEWFLGHSRGRTDGGEDTVIYRFDKAGKYLDQMVLLGGAHLYGFGVSDTNVLWLPHNDGGNDIITVQYEPGKTKTKADGTQMHVFTDNRAQVTFSPSRDWVCIWERTATTDTYRRYLKQNVLDGLDQPKGKAVAIPRGTRVVQGFSIVNDNLYLLLGAADQPASIEKWSFSTGKKLLTTPVTHVGLTAAETGMREPEGMDGRHFGVKVMQGTARKLRVYRHNL